MLKRIFRWVFGTPRNLFDPATYHKISLVAVLAWVGLGADGLSSSAYGPDEAFRTLGDHTYLALALTAATAFTVCVISYAYSRIIEHFPYGGGGYIVASRLLGSRAGVVSGSALLVDYILTISVSIASASDQLFSVLPHAWAPYKLGASALLIGILVILNLRGIKESIYILAPIFALFVVTHAILIFGGIASHFSAAPEVIHTVHSDFKIGLSTLGLGGMFMLFMRAYAMGGGTYTGIEAVSNGLQIMREPKIQTGKRTMLYMASSLAITAAGIMLCYLLFQVHPVYGKTMNAVLLESFAGNWRLFNLPVGQLFVIAALAAEAGLLIVAAQAGFIDGPRVMANMANDGWLPRRFAQLSDRLTMKNGVLLMGAASMIALLYTRGNITALVTMYSINVFLTFSLTELGMVRFFLRKRKKLPKWKRSLLLHGIGLTMCASILAVVIVEKFHQGGWITLFVTSCLIFLCFWIHAHYDQLQKKLGQLEKTLEGGLPDASESPKPLQKNHPTAVLLVNRYGGLGIHGLLALQQLFPNHFKNVIFVSIGVVDAASMAGFEEVELVRERTKKSLERYVSLARSLGFASEHRMGIATDVLAESEKICRQIAKDYPRTICFSNKLVFEDEQWFQRILHNETAHQLQRRLQFAGLHNMILPVRIFSG